VNMTRMNVRNFMVGLTLSEARHFRESIKDIPGYADEFIRELEAEDDTLIDVIFLEDYDGCDVFAVFPSLTDGPGLVTVYSHIGQHSTGTFEYCANCKEVTDSARYSDLAAELCRVGYEFRVGCKEDINWCEGCNADNFPDCCYDCGGADCTPPDDDLAPDCPGCVAPGKCVDCEYQTPNQCVDCDGNQPL